MNIAPPNNQEKFYYLNRNKYSLINLGVFSAALLIIGFLGFALSNSILYAFIPLILFMAVYLSISYGIGLFSSEFNYANHVSVVEKNLKESRTKKVAVFLPVCGEDIEIIKNVWNNVKKINWPNYTVYVLDDGKNKEVEKLAKHFNFNYITRENNYMKKSGNLRNAFFKTDEEFILILDADFCPRPDILNELMPYMIEDEKLCIVQSPQYFESSSWMSWVEQGAAQIQEFFYRYTQPSRNHFGSAICVGTSAIYRRKAIESMGGFRLKEWSEDVWNGFSMVNLGWKLKYVPLNLSKGRCPDDLRALFNQQYRWACGSLSLGKNKEFWLSNLTIRQKLCFVSGMMYFIFSSFVPFFILVPGPLAIWMFPEAIFYLNIMFYLPSLLFGTIVYKLWSHYKSIELYFFIIRLFTYFVNFFALKDSIFNTTMGWVATGAKQKKHINFTLYITVVISMVLLNWFFVGFGYVYNMDIINFYNVIPSFLSSLFYGIIFLFPLAKYYKII